MRYAFCLGDAVSICVLGTCSPRRAVHENAAVEVLFGSCLEFTVRSAPRCSLDTAILHCLPGLLLSPACVLVSAAL